MKKKIISSLLALCAVCLLTACNDDNDSNPQLDKDYSMTLYAPGVAGSFLDLAKSSSIELVCTYPDYGFPTAMQYDVEISRSADMSGSKIVESFNTNKMTVSATKIANALTLMYVEEDETVTEADFPKEIPVYVRVVAHIASADGLNVVESSRVVSNIITLERVKLEYSLPPVELPTEMYLVGSFCEKNWDKALSMVPTHSNPDKMWHMIYIDEAGVKFNLAKTDENAVGYDYEAGITFTTELDGVEFVNKDGWISVNKSGWYLMVVISKVVNRDITYEVQLLEPKVWLMGTTTPLANWSELEEGCDFTIEGEGVKAEFVSPAFAAAPATDSGLRAYVKQPGIDWWKTEFMIYDGKIVYRGAGDDQERVTNCEAGQKLYLNFITETGRIE
ncbi:MAG: SusF/SusE family outer membrane protein [Muribaculaceae bacterium]|nr:SusF/SusE family outer membrane protein [Muribaculaceae bacterium]